jgi:DNA-directed RNA polymerase subunit RPC12/RpoP
MKKLSIVFALFVLFSCQGQNTEVYVCDPCDLPCDTLTFQQPGSCPHCGMKLLKQGVVIKEANLVVSEIDITPGSGVFLVEGGTGKEGRNVKVYYHRPEAYTQDSKILIVIPGAGRNGDSYRDALIEASEKYNVLILSPMYAEEAYSFTDYHLGGIIKDANIAQCIEFEGNSNIAVLDERKLRYTVGQNPKEWIFDDFDVLFERVVMTTNSTQEGYDIFGHSAGGQILHRMAIFHPASKANIIIAANSGFYTLPSADIDLPFGVQNAFLDFDNIVASFENRLLVMIGALDNAEEDGGTLLRSPTVDKQGLHRLERGKYFYNYSMETAKEIGAAFNWKLNIVPDVGHDHRLMASAAAKILYEDKSH